MNTKTRHSKNHAHNTAIAVLGISMALIVVLHALAEGVARLGLFSLALGIIPVLVISQLKDWRYGLALGTTFGIVSLLTAVIKGYAGVPVWHNVINPLVSVLPRAVVGLAASLLSLAASKIFASIDRKHHKAAVDAELPPTTAEQTEEDSTLQPPQDEKPIDLQENANISVHSAIFAPKADNTNRNKQSIRARKIGRFTIEYLAHALITFICVILNAVGFLGMLLAFATGETVLGGSGYTFNLLYVLEFIVGTNTLIEAIVFTLLVPAIIQALKRAKVFR